MIASGGWDNTIQIYDIRKKGPVSSIYGPHICGDAIDFYNDGHTLLTGSYRQEDVLELWDLRKMERSRIIDWNGPKATDNNYTQGMELEKENDEENKENASPRGSPGRSPREEASSEITGFSRSAPAPFIYSAQFSNKFDVVMAAGAGANEVRLFGYKTGNLLCCIGDMNRAVLTLTKANTSSDFAFGSADSKIRIMQTRKIAKPVDE